MQDFPVRFNLKDGTRVTVNKVDDAFEFHLTRLNSERHNFLWKQGVIEESYETRFDTLQAEAVHLFEGMLASRP